MFDWIKKHFTLKVLEFGETAKLHLMRGTEGVWSEGMKKLETKMTTVPLCTSK